MFRRMAVPPPQQKFFFCSPSMVTSGRYQAARSAVGKLARLGMNKRMVVVVPTVVFPSGAAGGCTQHTPVRQSDGGVTNTSKHSGQRSFATGNVIKFTLE